MFGIDPGFTADELERHGEFDAAELMRSMNRELEQLRAVVVALSPECGECGRPFVPEPQNTTGFCSWACFDSKPREGAPEAFLAFLPAGTQMQRLDHPTTDPTA